MHLSWIDLNHPNSQLSAHFSWSSSFRWSRFHYIHNVLAYSCTKSCLINIPMEGDERRKERSQTMDIPSKRRKRKEWELDNQRCRSWELPHPPSQLRLYFAAVACNSNTPKHLQEKLQTTSSCGYCYGYEDVRHRAKYHLTRCSSPSLHVTLHQCPYRCFSVFGLSLSYL